MIQFSPLPRAAQRHVLAAVFCLLLLSVFLVRQDSILSIKPIGGLNSQSARLIAGKGEPKITVIAIWNTRGDHEPVMLRYFFQSVELNPMVDLLFVNIVPDGQECRAHSKAPNIKELCLTPTKYYSLHVEFLCQRWQCTDEDRIYLLRYLAEYMKKDRNHSFFRLLRGGIFDRYLSPSTTIWGWCDLDEWWGSFERTFPWDVAHDYDIIAITSQPDFRHQRLLFTRGHMAFFRHTPELLNKLHSYPKFSSMAAFLTLPQSRVDAEESEFSHFMFGQNDSFTFIHVEGMIDSYRANAVSPWGAFYFDIGPNDSTPEFRKKLTGLFQSRQELHRQPTFTDGGVENKTHMIKGKGDVSVWFPDEFAVVVEPGWAPLERTHKGIFYRREPGGPILEWLEPSERYFTLLDGIEISEAMYKHWGHEKKREWFQKLPPQGLKSDETFVQFHGDEVQIWDTEGNVVFQAGPP